MSVRPHSGSHLFIELSKAHYSLNKTEGEKILLTKSFSQKIMSKCKAPEGLKGSI
jgi:hypothetical protein